MAFSTSINSAKWFVGKGVNHFTSAVRLARIIPKKEHFAWHPSFVPDSSLLQLFTSSAALSDSILYQRKVRHSGSGTKRAVCLILDGYPETSLIIAIMVQSAMHINQHFQRQSNTVQVQMHLNGNYTRLLVFDLPGYCRPEPIWEIPTSAIPPYLRQIGSRFILEIDLVQPEEQDQIEDIREAIATSCCIKLLHQTTVSGPSTA